MANSLVASLNSVNHKRYYCERILVHVKLIVDRKSSDCKFQGTRRRKGVHDEYKYQAIRFMQVETVQLF